MTKFTILLLITAIAVSGCSNGQNEAAEQTVSKSVTPDVKVETKAVIEKEASSATKAVVDISGDNTDFNLFLEKYVVEQNGIHLVKYGAVSDADKASLKGYVAKLSEAGAPAGSKEEIMAYWFNLYNAETVNLILDNYPTPSIRKISRPWAKKRLTVAGKAMSLNNIEHDTVRAKYDDPRVHYAFNCASIGCPNLKSSAWEAATLDTDLDQAAKDYVASPRGVSVSDKGKVTVSKIYKWYKEDFGNNDAGILNHVITYAAPDKKAALKARGKIDKSDYDWSLNESK